MAKVTYSQTLGLSNCLHLIRFLGGLKASVTEEVHKMLTHILT